jgi:hypothetical protein
MPNNAPPMSHRKAGNAQVGLSYFFLAGFFAILILQGLGYIKLDMIGQLAPMAMLVLSFWFQRQRESTPEIQISSEHPPGPKAPPPQSPTPTP